MFTYLALAADLGEHFWVAAFGRPAPPGPTRDLRQGTEAKACQRKGIPRNAQKWPEKPRDRRSAPLPTRDPRKSTATLFPDVSGSFCGSLAGFPGCRADSGLFWVCDFQWQTWGSRSLCGALQGGPWPAGPFSAGSGSGWAAQCANMQQMT